MDMQRKVDVLSDAGNQQMIADNVHAAAGDGGTDRPSGALRAGLGGRGGHLERGVPESGSL